MEIDETADSVMDTSPFRSEDIADDRSPATAARTTPLPLHPLTRAQCRREFAADVEVFPTADEPVIEEPDAEPDIDRNLTTPINVAEVMGSEVTPSAGCSRRPAPLHQRPWHEVDESNADTQDIATRPQQPAEAPAPSDASTGLSDDDIDRIAHRLLELAGDRIDRIAWEVLPGHGRNRGSGTGAGDRGRSRSARLYLIQGASPSADAKRVRYAGSAIDPNSPQPNGWFLRGKIERSSRKARQSAFRPGGEPGAAQSSSTRPMRWLDG